MKKLVYCLNCRKISVLQEKCPGCNSKAFKELNKNAPVNVIGSKIKGRIYKVNEETVDVLIVGQQNQKTIKAFEYSKLKKIL